jgi:hypothetical protein
VGVFSGNWGRGKVFPRYAACGMTGIMPSDGICRITGQSHGDGTAIDAA